MVRMVRSEFTEEEMQMLWKAVFITVFESNSQ